MNHDDNQALEHHHQQFYTVKENNRQDQQQVHHQIVQHIQTIHHPNHQQQQQQHQQHQQHQQQQQHQHQQHQQQQITLQQQQQSRPIIQHHQIIETIKTEDVDIKPSIHELMSVGNMDVDGQQSSNNGGENVHGIVVTPEIGNMMTTPTQIGKHCSIASNSNLVMVSLSRLQRCITQTPAMMPKCRQIKTVLVNCSTSHWETITPLQPATARIIVGQKLGHQTIWRQPSKLCDLTT